MKKRLAQISIFIIIALVLVGILASLIILQKNKQKSFDSLSFNEQSEILKESFNECLRLIHQNSLQKVASQGGYYNVPLTPYIDAGFYDIPFYYIGELQYIPEPQLIEEELALASEFQLDNCFNILSERNFEYDYLFKTIKPAISEDEVTFVTDLDLTIKKENERAAFEIKNSPIRINSKLKDMNELAAYIAYSHQINNESLCVTCFTEIADDKELFVEFFNDYETVSIVSITDNRTNVYPQTYNFALSKTITQQSNLRIITPEETQEFDDQEINIPAPESQ